MKGGHDLLASRAAKNNKKIAGNRVTYTKKTANAGTMRDKQEKKISKRKINVEDIRTR